MLVTNITVIVFQQEQETNAESNITVESERQVSVPSITTCLLILCSPEQIIFICTHDTLNMRALDIQQSLLIHCLCIDDITYSLE